MVIGLQLVSAGFQLPKQYQKLRWKEMAICLVPVMALMWIFSTVCIIITIPNLNFVRGPARERLPTYLPTYAAG